MRLDLDVLLIIVLCVVTCGLAVSVLCDTLGRPYLVTVRGTRLRLAMARLLSWLGAAASGLLGWVVLIHLFPELLALAAFFGFEAVLLDVCAQRILYVPASVPLPLPLRNRSR
ncbi:MAG TPA: hypothetical protein VFI42_00560 [Thermomicrobiaceae bacterium]|nr:hypothetical protein [Thermomicrobiaceae bacterium]